MGGIYQSEVMRPEWASNGRRVCQASGFPLRSAVCLLKCLLFWMHSIEDTNCIIHGRQAGNGMDEWWPPFCPRQRRSSAALYAITHKFVFDQRTATGEVLNTFLKAWGRVCRKMSTPLNTPRITTWLLSKWNFNSSLQTQELTLLFFFFFRPNKYHRVSSDVIWIYYTLANKANWSQCVLCFCAFTTISTI